MDRLAKWSIGSLFTPHSGAAVAPATTAEVEEEVLSQCPRLPVMPAASSITTAQSLAVSIAVTGRSGTPTGSVVLSSAAYSSAAVTLTFGSASITIPAGSLATGSDTLTAKYTPDAATASVCKGASRAAMVTVTQAAGHRQLRSRPTRPQSFSAHLHQLVRVDHEGIRLLHSVEKLTAFREHAKVTP